MAMAMKQKKIRGRIPILELLFPKMIRETKCTKCGRPFLEHPDREPSRRFAEHNVEALIYEQRTGLRKEVRVRVGVWHPVSVGFQFGQLFEEQDLRALLSVVAQAVEFAAVEEEGISKSTGGGMSFRRS